MLRSTSITRSTFYALGLLFASFVLTPIAYADNTHSTSLVTDEFFHITDANQTGLDITGDMTIEAWLRLDADPGTDEWVIASKHNTASPVGRGYVFALGDTDKLTVYIAKDNSGQSKASVSWDPDTGIWYHVAVVYDASEGEATFYVNGVQEGTTQTGLHTSINNNDKDFAIGARSVSGSTGGDYFLNGDIDEVRIWSATRTASEINTNKSVELVGTETNLEGYWQLNNNADDLTSNNNDLTAENGPTYITDTPFFNHHAGLFDGSYHYLTLRDADQTGLDITGDLTLEAWVYLDTIPGPTEEMSVVSKYDSGSPNKGYNLAIGESDKLTLYISSNGTTHTKKQVSFGSLEASTWYHVAVTYDASAGSATFYVNGVQEGSAQTGLPTSIYNNAAPFDIAARGAGGDLFDGRIDEVRVWNDIRTASEIGSNKDDELVGTEANLQGYWKLNGDANDTTSNDNDFGIPYINE